MTPDYSALKFLSVTYQPPQETLLVTPITLPTSEPAVPQVSYTVMSGDLPSINISLYQKKYIGIVFGAGQFITAGTLYWRMEKNGVSVATGSTAITVNYRYTVQANFFNVTVNDVLEIALWSSVTDSNYYYKAYQIHLTRPLIFEPYWIMKPLELLIIQEHPVLTLGSPFVAGRRGYTIPHLDYSMGRFTGEFYGDATFPKGVLGMYQLGQGDEVNMDTAVVTQHATRCPLYNRNYTPTWTRCKALWVK